MRSHISEFAEWEYPPEGLPIQFFEGLRPSAAAIGQPGFELMKRERTDLVLSSDKEVIVSCRAA